MYLTPGAPSGVRVLVVDDDDGARCMVSDLLTRAGYLVTRAVCGSDALDSVAVTRPALILLDANMPGLTGFEVAKELRVRGYRQPVLMVTSYDDTEHIVQGLAAGADDYISKPVDLRILLARVNALLRRGPARTAVSALYLGDTVIDLRLKTARCREMFLDITATEFALLTYLAKHVGETVARADLLRGVWGYNSTIHTRTVDTHMWRLRKKLGDDGEESRWIHTRHGVGYALAPEALNAPVLAGV